ncbi:hypothetical protein E2562_007180 [Oryza meyeriana var. granulata]|uniref:DUF834 domain-containing protein n=1 Tax=Oryza meyeriana var. granulata TaxID=110450 RepID=A0A6G1CDR3_9ORYZ|nr:hypothetical protein E2562_007180 [Oryza meyeriana var. granulata]
MTTRSRRRPSLELELCVGASGVVEEDEVARHAAADDAAATVIGHVEHHGHCRGRTEGERLRDVVILAKEDEDLGHVEAEYGKQ